MRRKMQKLEILEHLSCVVTRSNGDEDGYTGIVALEDGTFTLASNTSMNGDLQQLSRIELHQLIDIAKCIRGIIKLNKEERAKPIKRKR